MPELIIPQSWLAFMHPQELEKLNKWRELPKKTVRIILTNERGKDEYAVVVSTLPDFWLHSFPNRDSALYYCKQFDLEIQGIIPFAI